MSTTTNPDRYDTGSAAWLAHEAANDRADLEAEHGPRLWDATPGVCCPAFQLGACSHTEGDEDDYLYDMSDAELADFRRSEAWAIANPPQVRQPLGVDEPF